MLPVVLVHGLIGSFADPRATALLRPAPVLCPDLLGYGTQAHADPDGISIEAQVEHVLAAVDRHAPGTPVTVAGHSVGGAIAMAFAHRFPDRVARVVNVEGNFTVADAFWSAQLARMPAAEVAALVDRDRADPARWLRDSGVEPTGDRIRCAAEALRFQPARTVHAAARAVVDFTGRPGYERLLREVFRRTPVHLVAGARSRAGWHVPAWALTAAAGYDELADSGHMVMLEAPEAFGRLLGRLAAG